MKTTALTLSRTARLFTTVVAVIAIGLTQAPSRTAHACGGYGDSATYFTPPVFARSTAARYVVALNQRSATALAAVVDPAVSFSVERHPSGCCPPPRWDRAEWLRMVRAQPRSNARLVSLFANEDASFTAEIAVNYGRLAYVEHLTLTALESGDFRITAMVAYPATTQA